MGPAPSYFDALARELREEGKLEIGKGRTGTGLNDAVVYKALTDPDLSVFSKEEKSMLDRIIEIYGGKSGIQLETLTHKEAPYLAVNEGEEMLLELVHYRGTQF